MIELSLIFAFLLIKYAIPDAVAAMGGKTTLRTRDKLARQQAAALRAHELRRGHLEPTLGEAITARIAVTIAPRHGPKPAKPARPPRQRGPWLRALLALWRALLAVLAWLGEFAKDAGEEAERRAVRLRFERKNRRRAAAGQPPIVINVHPCPGCDTGTVSRPDRLCPACTAAAAPSPPPNPPPNRQPDPDTYQDPDTVPDLTPPEPETDAAEPAPGPDPTREDTDVTDPLVIDPNATEVDAMLEFVEANDDWLGKVNEQFEVLRNNAAAGGVVDALATVDRFRAAIEGCRGDVALAVAKHQEFAAVKADVNSNADAAGIVKDTVLGARR